MSTVFVVAALTGVAALLGLPLFETVFGVLLLLPIVVYPFGGVVPPTFWVYVGAAAVMIGGLVIVRPGGFRRRSPVKFAAFESIGLFLVFFLLNYSLCLLWPDFISMGERLRDYALLSSVSQSPITPREPWLAGAPLNYYLYWYRFGHVLGVLGGLEVWELYPQLQSFTFALFLTSIFHLFRRFLGMRAELAVGAGVLITYGSNIAGVIAFFTHDTNWWGPSRVIRGAINEFPAWSFLLGDLHPHYLNLALTPFLIVEALAIGAVGGALGGAGLLAAAAVSPWWFFNANAWEVPLWGGLMAALAAVLGLAVKDRRSAWGAFRRRFAEWVRDPRLIGTVAVGLYLVWSLYLSSRTISPGDAPLRFVRGEIARSDLASLLLHWGAPLGVIAAALAALRPAGRERFLTAAAAGCTVLSGEALPLLALVLVLAVWRLWDVIGAARREGAPLALSTAAFEALGIVSLVFVVFPEIAFLDDPYGGENERMNTIFKIYAGIWFGLHSYAIYLLTVLLGARAGAVKKSAPLAIGALVCLVVMCGFFVRTIDVRRSRIRTVEPYAQGLSEISRLFPGAGGAIQDLAALPRGVVLEAQGPAYDYTSHVATLSGNRAYLGWANHVNLLNREYGEVARREKATSDFYETMSCEDRRSFLEREGIAYVVIGPLERRAYPRLDGESFGCLRTLIERGGYRVMAR